MTMLFLALSCTENAALCGPTQIVDIETGFEHNSIESAIDLGAERICLGEGAFSQPCGEIRVPSLQVIGQGSAVTEVRRGTCERSTITADGPIAIEGVALVDAGLFLSSWSTIELDDILIRDWTGGEGRAALHLSPSQGYRVANLEVDGGQFGYGDGLNFMGSSGGTVEGLWFHDAEVTAGYLIYLHRGVLSGAVIERIVRSVAHPGYDLVEVDNGDISDVRFENNDLNGPSLRWIGQGTADRLTLRDEASLWEASVHIDPDARLTLRNSELTATDGIWMEPRSAIQFDDVVLAENRPCDVRCDETCVEPGAQVDCPSQ